MIALDKDSGSKVAVGDVVVCYAGERWIFVDIIDRDMVRVMWDNVLYDMPTLTMSCYVVDSPTATA